MKVAVGFLAFILLLTSNVASGQCSGTATAATSGNWNSGPPAGRATWTFTGGATSPNNACLIVIPAGITVTINNNQTWIGSVEVYGTLVLDAILTLGTVSGCGLTLRIFDGGKLTRNTFPPGANDRLVICGQTVLTNQPVPPDGAINWPPSNEFDSSMPGGGFGEGGPLPVVLISFVTKVSGNQIVLDWATSKEEDFDRFVVEHSINGVDFSGIGEVPGAGYNTEIRIDYTHTHTLPIIGYNYYRLKAVDLDGSYEYFGPIVARYNSQRSVWAVPNPSNGEQVEFRANFAPGEGDRVQVYNQMGQLVADVPVKSNSGLVTFAEPLRSGSYILRYNSLQHANYARFIVLK